MNKNVCKNKLNDEKQSKKKSTLIVFRETYYGQEGRDVAHGQLKRNLYKTLLYKQ